MAQSPRLCQTVVPPVWAMVPPNDREPGGGIARLGGGTTQCSVSVRLTLAVVSHNTGGGTARTQETRDEIFLGSKFEST